MAFKGNGKKAASRTGKGTGERKAMKYLAFDLAEWDIEETYRNAKNTFASYKLTREGYQTYFVTAFADTIAAFDADPESVKVLYAGLQNHKGDEDATWSMRLIAQLEPF